MRYGQSMKIFYDFQILNLQEYGGISRYYYELITRINRLGIAEAEIKCSFSRNKYFESYFNKKADGGGDIKKISAFAFNTFSSLFEEVKGYDIIAPTYFYAPFIKKGRGKMVLTVYDMIHEVFPDIYPKMNPTVKLKKRMIYGADHIIAISESTKRDILRFYPDIPEEKISVIYIGSSFNSVRKSENISLPKRYVLFVGNRKLYKNFNVFFDAMRDIFAEFRDLKLVCMGGGKFSMQEIAFLGQYRDRVIQMDVSDDKLAAAYAGAECFVFPSLYEGFGIPTLEAFECSCPVVLSNSSSMPEVGGDAVLYCDPYSVEDMREKIRRVLIDGILREKLKEKGRRQLEKFDWDDIARQVVGCYEEVLKK